MLSAVDEPPPPPPGGGGGRAEPGPVAVAVVVSWSPPVPMVDELREVDEPVSVLVADVSPVGGNPVGGDPVVTVPVDSPVVGEDVVSWSPPVPMVDEPRPPSSGGGGGGDG